MPNIEFNKLDNSLNIPDNAKVRVTKAGHIVDITHISHDSDILRYYRKIDSNYYTVVEAEADIEHYYERDVETGEMQCVVVNKDTGEMLEAKKYNLNENRAQSTAGLKRTMRNIRNLINNNFIGASNELFITLTYALMDGKPMNDVGRASGDFGIFIKRFRRRYPDLEYVAILEPQENTAWHWHVLAKFAEWHEKEQIYIDNNGVIAPMWGHGFTSTRRIDHVDNIGAYLGAYLSSLEINEDNLVDVVNAATQNGRRMNIVEKEVIGEDGQRVTKKYAKYARMNLYPSGTNIYRYSRGIKKPLTVEMAYADAKKLVGEKEPDFSRTIVIEHDEEGSEGKRTLNRFTHEQYNLKRKSKPE